MKFSFTVDSRQLQANIDRTIVRVRRESRNIVRDEAMHILQMSLAQVPRDTNALANSARVEELADGNFVVAYGGDGQVNPKTGVPVDDYMIEVHEDLSKNHPNGGKAKFLEDPVREAEKQWLERVAIRLRKHGFKGGTIYERSFDGSGRPLD